MFFVVLGAGCFLVQGQRGGCTRKKRGGVPAPHSLNSFVFLGLPLLFGFHDDDTEKSGETIATPPETGVPTGPDSGTEYHASIRPQGVAIVGIYPCGKARKRRLTSGADQAENGPMELRKTYRKLTTALSRFWHREAGPMNWKNPVRVVAYIGWEIFNGVAFLVGEWVRYGVRAGQIVLAIPPTVILFFGGGWFAVWSFVAASFSGAWSVPVARSFGVSQPDFL